MGMEQFQARFSQDILEMCRLEFPFHPKGNTTGIRLDKIQFLFQCRSPLSPLQGVVTSGKRVPRPLMAVSQGTSLLITEP